ncbi:MAG: VIT1/CCC1 transporter family protein [Patescibacteria group bacterium]
MIHNTRSVSFFRNFVFGVEDSLVSTVGLLSGIALASVSRETIFLTGIVLIFVEAFSMSAGSFLSESSAEEYAGGADQPARNNVVAAVIMFFSYFFAGFVPLFPYLLWPVGTALALSVLLSMATLFCLGLVSATLSRTGLIRSGLRMAAIGGLAIVVGALAGAVVSRL